MNKELIDHVWKHCLPKEFKEEVKKEWQTANNEERLPHDAFLRGCYSTMVLLFGYHNLTSDAEGEEMLTVEKGKVQFMFDGLECTRVNDEYNRGYKAGKEFILHGLFGSKCPPDEGTDCTPVEVGVAENATTTNVDSSEANVDSSHGNVESLEPKPAEPKYHRGEKVCYNGYVYEIEGLVGKNRYALKGLNFDLDEDMIEPYIKPEENIAGNRNLSQDCDKEFDNILKNSFSKERRLNIAAMAMQGMLSNTTRFSSYEISDLVRISLNCADALITKSEEGGNQ